MTLQVTSPVPREHWTTIHAQDPAALIAQTPAWIDCLTASGYADATRMYESASGWRAVLPMVRRATPLPRRLAPQLSMPNAWGMGGLICESPPSPRELEAVAADLRSLGAVSTRIRPNPLHAEQFAPLRGSRLTEIPRLPHVLHLDGGPAGLWQRLNTKARHCPVGESGASRWLAPFKEQFGARPGGHTESLIGRLPLSRADAAVRGAAKRVLRFRDV